MCKYQYYKTLSRSGREMLFCKLKDDSYADMEQLCLGQYFCTKEDKYLPRNQKQNCKNYKEEE